MRTRRSDGGQDKPSQQHSAAKDGTPKSVGSNQWTVIVLEVAKKEGKKILSPKQYEHIVSILKRLVDYGTKEISDLDIKPIDTFFELREKGGVLGRMNLRIYFGTIPEDRELVIAKVYKKEEEAKTPRHIVLVVEERLEGYEIVRHGKNDTVYKEVTSRK